MYKLNENQNVNIQKQLNKQAVLMKILTTMVEIYQTKIYYLLTLLKNAKENAKR
jgi:hypothetical protein